MLEQLNSILLLHTGSLTNQLTLLQQDELMREKHQVISDLSSRQPSTGLLSA